MIHAREDYNRIQDPAGKIPSDEPVFLLRAQDQLACLAVAYYATLCRSAQAPEVAARAQAHADRMAAWPKKKVPDLSTAAPAQQAPSDEARRVGDSMFEDWFAAKNMAGLGTKQLARDAYAAGMADATPQAQPAEPSEPTPATLLAETVLSMSMVTPLGLRARSLARQVLDGNDEVLRLLRLIEHATAPEPDDRGSHEAAHDLAVQAIARLVATPAEAPAKSEPEPDADGWIKFDGFIRPADDVKVFIRLRDGSESGIARCSRDWIWIKVGCENDITHYRIAGASGEGS